MYWSNRVSVKSRVRFSGVMTVVLLSLLLPASKSDASSIDLHWQWDNQCAECHGHSSDFAEKFLKLTDGQLQGVHHIDDLRGFMRNHYTSNNEVDAVYKMLLAQAGTKPRFKQECSVCHDRASAFVRQSVVLQDGVLLSRESAQPIENYLQRHRRLQPDDVEFFMRLLNRVAHEVYRP